MQFKSGKQVLVCNFTTESTKCLGLPC